MKTYLLNILLLSMVLYSQGSSTWITEPPEKQLTREGVDDQLGFGRVFVPAMTDGDLEPALKIYSSSDKKIYEGYNTGESIFLKPGKYSLVFGSSEEPLDLIQEHFTIYEHQTKIIEPDWSGLVVSVIDENMEYVRFGYEIINMENEIPVGSRYSKEESNFDDFNPTWILKPGKYKIVKQGEPFNTIVNFTTLELKKGELKEMTIVVNDDGNFIGSGELGLLKTLTISEKSWRNKLNLKGSISLISLNKDNDSKNTTFITSQINAENRYIYDSKPYYLNFSQSLKEEFTSINDKEDLRISIDEIELNSTGIYYFTDVFGIYGELSFESKIFPSYFYDIPDNVDVRIIYRNSEQHTKTGIEKFKTSDPFTPVNLSENFGFNFTFIQTTSSNLYLRTGFGFKQFFNDNVYSSVLQTDTLYAFNEKKDEYSKGIILTAGSDISFSGNITYNSTADLFYNLDDERNYRFEWENDLIFKLFRYVSISYNLTFLYDYRSDSTDNYLEDDHQLALEFSYYLNR